MPEQPESFAIDIPRFPRVADYAGAWSIEPNAGSMLLAAVQRTDLAAHVASAEQPKMVAARDDFQTVKVAGGQQVAVVPLAGTLMKSVSSMSAGTSTVMTRRMIRKAAADPDVSAILIHVDSPGGTVSGTADLAAEVQAAAKQKPVWAFIEDMGASAAYWVASQADKVFANNPTALVGSIGTLAVIYDYSAAAEKEGIKALVFGTGPLKGAGAPGAKVTDEQQAYFRNLVEDSQTSFDAAVRKARGLSEKQLADARTGGVFGAAEALDRKLIDGIQSFDKTVADLAAEARRQNRSSSTTRAAGPIPARSVTVEENTNTTAVATTVADPAAATSAMNASLAANMDRIAGIQRVCGPNATLAAQAIRENWSVEATELKALKASLASGVGVANPHAGPHLNFGAGKWRMGSEAAPGVSVNEALEATIRMSLGRNDVEREHRPEVCQAARESFKNYGLQQILMLAAVQNGYPGHPGERINKGNLKSILKAAFGDPPGITASGGASTVSLPGILGNVANKELLGGYTEEDMTWKEIAQIKSVSNFQQVTSYRMLDDMEYEKLAPDGRIKHGSAGEESYTRQADTFAKMFALTRKQIINDDLGAFDDIRTRLGRGSGKKFNKVFWTGFLANTATFWTAARTNYITGATTNLGVDGVGIGLGVLAFRKMRSPAADGTKAVNADTQNPVGSAPGGRPEILLVPPELEGNAEVIYRNQNLGSVKNSDANIYQNKYRPVVAWQLSDVNYPGYSLTAWYLLNNPAYLAAMVVSFLNGNMAPTVETADADFDQLGIQFRGYHDFGCDQAEYLAGVKSKGAA